jgi:AraC-like DNA-binding protein
MSKVPSSVAPLGSMRSRPTFAKISQCTTSLCKASRRTTGLARLSPRYIHMLFEGEGTTFSTFVREQRLLHARNMLRSPRYGGQAISSIAFAAGFGDLSHFNRSFRRRFGASPTELRLAR